MSYEWLSNINQLEFEDRSIAVIGAGYIAEQYCHALFRMKIKDTTVISRSEQKARQLCSKFDFKPLGGGFEKHLPSLKTMDLVIIATPISSLIPAAAMAIQHGQTNILIEKPVSLYRKEMLSLGERVTTQRVRVAYNRLVYPNLHMLKERVQEDGISSCWYTFTEWPHTYNFDKLEPDVLSRMGIANSLHVISMAHELIGMPSQISTYRSGSLSWHQSGSTFVGSGITEKGVPFSYHADWESAGRWGIELMTKKNAYRLIPLEDLYICKKGSTNWEKVSFKVAFPDVKQGIAEEIAVMLDRSMEQELDLPSLEKAVTYNQLAEKIFGYDSDSTLGNAKQG